MNLGQPLLVMGYVVRLIDLMDLSPLMHFLFCEMGSLIRYNALQNVTPLDTAFCNSTDDGWCQGSTGREDKSTSRMCLYSSEEDHSPFRWKRPSVINLQVGPPGNGTILGPCIGLCCWQVSHRAVVLARSALGREAPKTSTPIEVIKGFQAEEGKVSSDIGVQATSTTKEDSEWIGGSGLLVSSGSNQLPSFQFSGFLSFLTSALSFTWEMTCWWIQLL